MDSDWSVFPEDNIYWDMQLIEDKNFLCREGEGFNPGLMNKLFSN